MGLQSVLLPEAFQLTENSFNHIRNVLNPMNNGRIAFENISFICGTWCCLDLFSRYGSASDDFVGGCKRKEQAIETKMEYARKHGNQEQLRGLEEALSQVRRWCSDGSLRARQNSKFWKSKIKCRSGKRILIRLSQKAREKRKSPSFSASWMNQRGAGAGRCGA